MLRLFRNHSAFNSHNFPRTYTTTYPYVAAPPQPNALTRKAQGFGNYLVSSGCTYGLDTVSFHSFSLSVYFDAVSAQGFARPLSGLLATHLAIVYQYIQPTCRDCTLHVPRRLWKVADSNRLLIYSIRGPPLNAGEGDAHLFQCRFAPTIPAFTFLILILSRLLLWHSNSHHLNSFMSS